MYYVILEFSFGSFYHFYFSAITSYLFIHCEHIFIYILEHSYDSVLKSLATNFNIWVISRLALLIIFSLEKWVTLFLVLQMPKSFGLYPRHCKYYVVETLDSVISL